MGLGATACGAGITFGPARGNGCRAVYNTNTGSADTHATPNNSFFQRFGRFRPRWAFIIKQIKAARRHGSAAGAWGFVRVLIVSLTTPPADIPRPLPPLGLRTSPKHTRVPKQHIYAHMLLRPPQNGASKAATALPRALQVCKSPLSETRTALGVGGV